MERPDNAQANARATSGEGTVKTAPDRGNKVERITGHSKQLVEDVKSWVELKIKFTKLEILEQLEEKKDEFVESLEPLKKDAIVGGIAGLFFVVALVFLFTAGALFLGTWLGHPGWGFLVMTGVLLVVAALLFYVRFGRKERAESSEEPDQLAPPVDTQKLISESSPKQLASGPVDA